MSFLDILSVAGGKENAIGDKRINLQTVKTEKKP
jgi:hypothetical protein